MTAGVQRAARGRAGGADVKVGESDTLIVHAVHIRRFQNRIAVRRNVAEALIVGEDKDDIRPSAGEAGRVQRGRNEQGREEEEAEGELHEGCDPLAGTVLGTKWNAPSRGGYQRRPLESPQSSAKPSPCPSLKAVSRVTRNRRRLFAQKCPDRPSEISIVTLLCCHHTLHRAAPVD